MSAKAWMAMLVVVVALAVIGRGQELTFSPTATGQSVALQATEGGDSPVTLADTGPLDSAGGSQQTSLPDGVAYPGIAARQLYALTSGFGNQSRSQASVAAFDFWLGNHRVTALWTEAQATARGGFLNVLTSGAVTVNNLTIDGTTVAVSGAPNQRINLQDGYVIVNEQTGSTSRDYGEITVNAIHFVVNGVGSVIAASAKAEVINQPTRNPALP